MEDFQKNRVRGSLVGSTVGDALGYDTVPEYCSITPLNNWMG